MLEDHSRVKMGDWLIFPVRDWSLLPDDVMQLIVSRIKFVEDLMTVSAVCRSWRSVAVKDYVRRRVQLPWLMLADNHDFETKGFCSIDRKKLYNIMFPNFQGSRCWGSKFGWLVILTCDRQFYLFNPLTRVVLDLPPKPIFRDEIDHHDEKNGANSIPGFIRKALVCRDGIRSRSNEDQFIVIAIGNVSGNLALARPGGKCWIHVKTPFGRIMSAVWCNDRLFVMLGSGVLMCCENDDYGKFEVEQFVPEFEDVGIWDNMSLVESVGDLLLVVRYCSQGNKNWLKTSYFNVYKMDFEKKEWIELYDLGDCALFVDADDSAMALKASEVNNCESNCIYFVEKHWHKYGRYVGSNDVGVYKMKNQCIEPYFICDPSTSPILHPNPIWVMPSLC